MIITTQSSDPIVVLGEKRYLQLLEAESIIKDDDRMIVQLIKYLMKNPTTGSDKRVGDTIDLPDFIVSIEQDWETKKGKVAYRRKTMI